MSAMFSLSMMRSTELSLKRQPFPVGVSAGACPATGSGALGLQLEEGRVTSNEIYWMPCFSNGNSSLAEFAGDIAESASDFTITLASPEPAQIGEVGA